MSQIYTSFSHEWQSYKTGERVWGYTPEEMVRRFEKQWGRPLGELKGKKVLDIGCGTGILAAGLAPSGAQITATDVAESTVQLARQRYKDVPNVTFAVEDILNISLPLNSFDVVHASGVIHHTPDPQKALINMARLTKPGGTVSFWVYRHRSDLKRYIQDGITAITSRLPCSIQSALYKALACVWFKYNGMTFDERVVWFWDAFGPRYRFRPTQEQAREWIAAAKLTEKLFEVERDGFLISTIKT